MPGKLKVRILAGRDLPIMDRVSDLTDAFVEIRFGNSTYKTDVCRKSLNPQWNSEWFRFEVDDEDLQDEPLEIKVLDYDTYSAHDAIGKVYIDLNPLLVKDGAAVISGWFPIYDTMHGIRGEINVLVKIELFTDFNKFRQSSCGVQFFNVAGVPSGHKVAAIHGFVEELVVNDDPEYQWIDKIRTPRASNEARQRLFSKLSGELQRKIGLKVLEMGGNAAISYRQCFDLEGESGIVVRAIGTSVTLTKLTQTSSPNSGSPSRDFPLPEDSVAPPSGSPTTPAAAASTVITPTRLSSSPAKVGSGGVPVLHRRSSDSDLSTPPKGSSLTGSSGSGGGSAGKQPPFHRPVLQQQSVEMLEFPFFTIRSLPPYFLVHLGGVVSARSVKLLDKIQNPEEHEARDVWWMEIRTEIRSHCRAMGCHAVIGYTEQTTICDEVIILSASGTAAIVNMRMESDIFCQQPLTMSLDRSQFEKEKKLFVDVNLANQAISNRLSQTLEGSLEVPVYHCSICHIPYNDGSAPFPVNLNKCAICRRSKVPDILFSTIEPPDNLQIVGKGCLIQARICRAKKDAKGETNAKEVSDSLPFLEYELHNQLINKLKVRGMNMLFGLKIQVTLGKTMLIAVATATAVYAAALPPPPVPKIVSGKTESDTEPKHLTEIQKRVQDVINQNKEAYNLHPPELPPLDASPRGNLTDESEDELTDLDLSSGNKDAFVLEIDDAEDTAMVQLLLDAPAPEGFDMCNTESMPGVPNLVNNLQMCTRVWRAEVSSSPRSKDFSNMFDQILKSLYFKLRGRAPCCLCDVDFSVELPEEDQIQVSVTTMCCGVGSPPQLSHSPLLALALSHSSEDTNKTPPKSVSDVSCSGSSHQGDDMMFMMEGVTESVTNILVSAPVRAALLCSTPAEVKGQEKGQGEDEQKQPKMKYHSLTAPAGVEITPLAAVPGGRVEHYLGNLNFFIIRESTSIREEGGLNGFIHSFIAEMMAIIRAHVAALGGNALLSYQMSECVLEDNVHKNQGQCLVNVSGDVAQVIYDVQLDPPKLGAYRHKSGSISPLPSTLLKPSPRNSPKTERN